MELKVANDQLCEGGKGRASMPFEAASRVSFRVSVTSLGIDENNESILVEGNS